jgi:Subtilase family
MRQDRGSNGSLRWSALWAKPSKGETRGSALWGKGGRGFLATLVVALGLAAPAAYADSGSGFKAYTTPGLIAQAQASPKSTFDVILVGSDRPAGWLAKQIAGLDGAKAKVRRQFTSIDGVAARLTGSQILTLAHNGHIQSITYDAPITLAGLSNKQRWPFVSGVQKFWSGGTSAATPTIAIVDSGIDAGRADFGSRVVAQVNLSSLTNNSVGDGRGHGTLVAGIAAGSGDGYAGAAPASKLVSLDVMDDNGMAMTRDVIAAADWILANKDKHGIKVANFSLHSSQPNSFMYDPLDKAVERLWFSGVVVVAAAGNYGVAGQRAACRSRPATIPSSSRSAPTTSTGRPQRWTTPRLRGLPTGTRSTASPNRTSPPPAATWSGRRRAPPRSPSSARRVSSRPATSSFRAPPSRRRSSRAEPPRSWPRTPRGAPIRSRAP